MRLASFDLFDTLITRITREPKDIFRLIGASEMVHYRWRVLRLVPFHLWRRQAERLARKLTPREEIRLVDIYKLLGAIIKNPSKVMRLEMQLEDKAVRLVPELIKRLNDSYFSGAQCCITSDMYLPKAVLRKMVQGQIPDIPIYVSSEIGHTKTSGKLFEHISSLHKVNFGDMLHVGDNPVADDEVPRRLGINTALVYTKKYDSSACVLDALKCPDDDPFYEMGFRVAGPTAFVMALCLAEYVEKYAPPNVIFAARDMHLVDYAFRRISSYMDTHYCRISRSAVYRAQWHANAGTERLFEGVRTGRDFFRRLNLDCPAELLDLTPHQYGKLFLDALYNTNFPDECEREYVVVRDYLENQGFCDGALFVDLGWRGSIQDSINDILKLNVPISGFYFGTTHSGLNKTGLYFSSGSPYRRSGRVLQAISFFEFLLTEPVPSLARIERSGDSFGFIYTNDESKDQVESRMRITKGAKDYLDSMTSLCSINRFRVNCLLGALDKVYNRYLLEPPARWVKSMDVMTHSGGFGGSGTFSLIGDDSGSLMGFLGAPWRAGYLIKHSNSPWAPAMSSINNPIFHAFYDSLKRKVHGRRMGKLHKF